MPSALEKYSWLILSLEYQAILSLSIPQMIPVSRGAEGAHAKLPQIPS